MSAEEKRPGQQPKDQECVHSRTLKRAGHARLRRAHTENCLQGRMETVGMSSSKWQGKLTLSYKYQLRVPVPKLLQIHPHSSD